MHNIIVFNCIMIKLIIEKKTVYKIITNYVNTVIIKIEEFS